MKRGIRLAVLLLSVFAFIGISAIGVNAESTEVTLSDGSNYYSSTDGDTTFHVYLTFNNCAYDAVNPTVSYGSSYSVYSTTDNSNYKMDTDYGESTTISYTGTTASGEPYGPKVGEPTEPGTYTATQTIRLKKNGYIYEDGRTFTLVRTFTITPKPVTVKWDEQQLEYNYDGEGHGPTASFDGNPIIGDDTCSVSVAYRGTTKGGAVYSSTDKPVNAGDFYRATYSLSGADAAKYVIDTSTSDMNGIFFAIRQLSLNIEWRNTSKPYNGEAQEPTYVLRGLIPDDEDLVLIDFDITGSKVTSDGKAIDAGTYSVVAKNNLKDSPNLPADDRKRAENYKITTSTADRTNDFYITPKRVDVTWYRYKNDNYGNRLAATAAADSDEIQDGDYVLTPVADDAIVRLPFNGKTQRVIARVSPTELCTREDTGEPDVCTVNVSGQGKNADDEFTATAEGLTNSNYELSSRKSTQAMIVKRPVVLAWSETVAFVYNGEKQGPEASVSEGIQKDVNGKDIACDVSGYEVTENTDTSSTTGYKEGLPAGIDESRLSIDAANYTKKAVELSNGNYTLVQLRGDTADSTGDNSYSDTDIDVISQNFYIDQKPISVAWNNDSFSKVYNASSQLPDASLEGLIEGDDVVLTATTLIDGEEKAVCNVGEYAVRGNIENADHPGYKNYTFTEGEVNVWTADAEKSFVITKAPLSITANPKSISYGDDPASVAYDASYKGLLNGEVNTDAADGKPSTFTNNDGETEQVVVDSDNVEFTYNYIRNGRPGSYTISIVQNLTSHNYEISYVPGTLTVFDKVSTLVAKGVKKGKKIKLSWNGVTGAASYDVYISKCNRKGNKYTPKYFKTVSGTTLTVKKLGGKKLKPKTCYKYYVVAKNAAGNPIARSLTGHCITGKAMGRITNAKSMKVNAGSATIGRGGTYKLSASYKKAKKGKKYRLNNHGHSPLTRFVSENPAVATVDANGVVTGVGAGWCRVYVQGVTGMWQVVEINVQ